MSNFDMPGFVTPTSAGNSNGVVSLGGNRPGFDTRISGLFRALGAPTGLTLHDPKAPEYENAPSAYWDSDSALNYYKAHADLYPDVRKQWNPARNGWEIIAGNRLVWQDQVHGRLGQDNSSL